MCVYRTRGYGVSSIKLYNYQTNFEVQAVDVMNGISAV